MEWGFVLKKTISIMIMPLSIVLFVLLIGFIFLLRNKIALGKIIVGFGIVILALISYNPVANKLINNLEKQYTKLECIPQNVDHILLLGGDFEQRAWEVLRLYHQNKNLKIITSGYEGNRQIAEALRSANLLIELGIPKEKIIIHEKPKDTKEEAVKMKELLGKKPFLLVTAGYHMPRAIGLFKKEGTNPIAAPSHFIGKDISFNTIPSAGNLLQTQVAMHEYIGILWAKLRGQI